MHPVRLLCTLTLGLLLAGCPNEVQPEPPPPPETEPVPDAGSVTVTLTRTVRYLSAEGEVARLEALEPPVELLLPTQSGYSLREVTEEVAGRAVVRDVPEGPFWVRTGRDYILTQRTELELGGVRVGRPDALRTGSATAALTLSAQGLQPWNESPTKPNHAGVAAEDQLQVLSPEAGALGLIFLDTEPAVGATELEQVQAELFSFSGPLPQLSASRDTLHVSQQSLREGWSAGDVLMHYTSVRKAAAVPAPDFVGTPPLVLDVALEDVAQKPFALVLPGVALEALATAVHPEARHNNTVFEITPTAHGEQNGRLDNRLSLLKHLQTGGTDLSAPVEYGNPFPAAWGELARASAVYLVDAKLSEDESVQVAAVIAVEDTPARLDGVSLEPGVLPPRNLQVDGAPAIGTRTLASRTPVLSWDAPATGTPTHYAVVVRRLELLPEGGARPVVVATLKLPASVRTLRFPEGILEPSAFYVFNVGAHVAASWTERPLDVAFPTASAEALTGALSTP